VGSPARQRPALAASPARGDRAEAPSCGQALVARRRPSESAHRKRPQRLRPRHWVDNPAGGLVAVSPVGYHFSFWGLIRGRVPASPASEQQPTEQQECRDVRTNREEERRQERGRNEESLGVGIGGHGFRGGLASPSRADSRRQGVFASRRDRLGRASSAARHGARIPCSGTDSVASGAPERPRRPRRERNYSVDGSSLL
jgi:hypothetical protein